LLLPHDELAYKAPSKLLGCLHSYELYPLGPLDLAPRSMEERLSIDANKRVEKIRSYMSKSKHGLKNRIFRIKVKLISIRKRWYFNPETSLGFT